MGVVKFDSLPLATAPQSSDFLFIVQNGIAKRIPLRVTPMNVGIVTLTDAATIATDASLGNVFSVILGGNRQLANPTNLTLGMTYKWLVAQDSAGTRTLTYGSMFTFGTGASTISTGANRRTIITGLVISSQEILTKLDALAF